MFVCIILCVTDVQFIHSDSLNIFHVTDRVAEIEFYQKLYETVQSMDFIIELLFLRHRVLLNRRHESRRRTISGQLDRGRSAASAARI